MKVAKRSIVIALALMICLTLFAALAPAANAAANGWEKLSNGYWLYWENGRMVCGWKTIDGKTYYFNTTGVHAGCMVTGPNKIDGVTYIFSSSGALSSGWVWVRNAWYYANEDCTAYSGWLKEDGKWYYFHDNGRMAKDEILKIDDAPYYFGHDGAMKVGWFYHTGWCYSEPNGVVCYGWTEIDGDTYYFNPDAYTAIHTIDQERYLFTLGGKLAISSWVSIQNLWYYGDSEGKVSIGWTEINGKTYYFGGTGVMYTGKRLIDNKYYIFGDDGVLIGEVFTGWKKVDGKWYYYNQEGDMVKNRIYAIDNISYGFDENGVMQTGWFKSHYFLENGQAARGGLQVDGVWRYFLNGQICYGFSTPTSGAAQVSYVCDENGVWQKNWQYKDNSWYYINDDGTPYNGWILMDGYWHYFDTQGCLKLGWLYQYGTWYYLDGNHYGRMVTSEFFRLSDGQLNRFAENGAWLGTYKGWQQTGTLWTYYADGFQHYGWLNLDGVWYYLSPVMATGWTKIGSTWYYFKDSGAMYTGWLKSNGDWYYLKNSGEMATGVVEIDGVPNFFGADGKWVNAVKPGWFTAGGNWYYYHSDGYMVTGWLQIDSTWYYFTPDYTMAVGPCIIGNNIYLFHTDGTMHTGWYQEDGSWYYFDPSGAMHFGWLQLNGKWYAFDEYGIMITGWGTDGQYDYYFNADGTMVTGWQTIDGESYYFDQDGHCTNR